MLEVLLFGPALIAFLVPCFLPGRWLAAYSAVALFGLIYLWRDYPPQPGDGNGGAEAIGLMALIAATVAVGAGATVGAARLAARHPSIAWRYAWVPVLITAAIVWELGRG